MRVIRSVLRGNVNSSPSKSYTHRSFIIGALTGEKFEVFRALLSEDTIATLSALEKMGAEIERGNHSIRINCPRMASSKKPIDAGNSGTTLRLISGATALLEGRSIITGDESLRKRPMKDLLNSLRELGAKCAGEGKDEHPPVKIQGPMTGTHTRLSGEISSQFISSLLLACPMKKSQTKIKITGKRKSSSYVDITLNMLKRFRVDVQEVSDGFEMQGRQRPVGSKFEVPGDFSSAAFILCGAAMTGGDVTISGLDPDFPQGDSAVIEILRKFGSKIELKDNSVRCIGMDRLPINIDIGNTPDLFPILGILASTADGESRLSGGEHLRFKESDRINATVRMLTDLGIDAKATNDGCIISGKGKIRGGTVNTETDHRIMMSGVIAGIASEQGVILKDDKSFVISYPAFMDDVQRLGAIIQPVSK